MVYKEILCPEYVESFSCIGSECEDTCCKNWSIFIDKTAYKRYKDCKDFYFNVQENEVARKALLNEEPMKFKYVKFPNATYFFYAKSTVHILRQHRPFLKDKEEYYMIRETLIDIIQYRDISLIDRMMVMGMYILKS